MFGTSVQNYIKFNQYFFGCVIDLNCNVGGGGGQCMLWVSHAFSDASLAGCRDPCALQRCIELHALKQAFWSPYLDLNIPFSTDFLSETTHILLLVISLAWVFLSCTVPALNLMQISIYQTAQRFCSAARSWCLILSNISPSPPLFSCLESS